MSLDSKKRNIRLVVFDLAGTTVDDNINEQPLVVHAFFRAFAEHGVTLWLVSRQCHCYDRL